MDFKIERMTINDLKKIHSTLEEDFDDFWNYNLFEQELKNSNSYFFVLKNNTEILGFAGFMIILDEADITNIVVKKDLRNKKLGSMLLNNLIEKIKTFDKIETITLEVNENNSFAIKMYEKFGFQHLGIRKNYYKDHTNALIMTKYLKPLEVFIKN